LLRKKSSEGEKTREKTKKGQGEEKKGNVSWQNLGADLGRTKKKGRRGEKLRGREGSGMGKIHNLGGEVNKKKKRRGKTEGGPNKRLRKAREGKKKGGEVYGEAQRRT